MSGGALPRSDRRAAVHARTRDEILDAAAELVVERSIDELNLSELATRAGFSNPASLYRYFASKQEIVSALATRGLERLGQHMRVVPADLPPAEQLVELCLAYIDYARAHPGERRLLLTTAASIRDDFRAARLPDEFVRRMFGLAQAARESGTLAARDDEDLFTILHVLWAVAHGMAEYDGLYEGDEREALRSRHRAVFAACIAGFGGDWRS